MTHPAELHTKRLILRGISPATIHSLFNTKSKEEIIHYFGCDENGYERMKNMHEQGMEMSRISSFFFLLIDKSTGLPIGECGFHTWNTYHHRTEVFYLLRSDEYKQKGIMTEAFAAVLEYGYTQMNLHRIEAKVASWNTPSVKLLTRFGFLKEGTAREDYFVDGVHEDSDCYSLLKPEWEKMRK